MLYFGGPIKSYGLYYHPNLKAKFQQQPKALMFVHP